MFGPMCGCVEVQKVGNPQYNSYSDNTVRKRATASDDELDGHLKNNLHTIRGRRQLMKDTQYQVEPTVFDDDDDIPSENEDGEETMVLAHGVFAGQSFERIRSKCEESGQRFVDPQFPPCGPSLYLGSPPPNPGPGGEIVWRRAEEICEGPKFLDADGGSRFDVDQGELGDCWLSAAIANLTLQKKLFGQVVPHGQSFEGNASGIFHFKFWQFGEWVDVVVDDMLPTRNGQLIYMRATKSSEFWSALLEKAYAKLYGSYSSLKGGTTSEAMVDFSGGCSEQYDLKSQQQSSSQQRDDVYEIMLRGWARSSMLASSVNPNPRTLEEKTPSGLIRGHAYSITDVKKIELDNGGKKFPLVRIRNPWGNDTEWKGAWSDGSAEWRMVTEAEKERLGLTFQADGEFYMSKSDFVKEYDTLELCSLGPDAFDDDELASGSKLHWHLSQFQGSWVAGKSAGGCRNYPDTFASNPQFRMQLSDSDNDSDGTCTCVVSLMQKGSRKKQSVLGEGCLIIGFAIYLVGDADKTTIPLDADFFNNNNMAAKPDAFINRREVTTRFQLKPGTYVIVPSTFDQNEEGDFLLRVFSESAFSMDNGNN